MSVHFLSCGIVLARQTEAGWMTLLWGEDLMRLYSSLFGLY